MNGSWWKGNLSQWILVTMIGIISYFVRTGWEDVMSTRYKMLDELKELNARMAVTETKEKALVETLKEIKDGIRSMNLRLTNHENEMRTGGS